MIDLHSHFLPGFDDGAVDVAESIKMLCDSYEQGVRICAGTSHAVLHGEHSIDTFLEKRSQKIEMLNKALAGSGEVVPQLIYGAEIYLDNDVSLYDGIKRLCYTGTDTLLVELSTDKFEPHYPEWLYNLSLKGMLPVIAHVERYPYLGRLTEELSGVKTVYQINARTLVVLGGKKVLFNLLDKGAEVIVSSDMHNMGQRRCCMKKAFDKINKRYPDLSKDIFENNAASLIKTNI